MSSLQKSITWELPLAEATNTDEFGKALERLSVKELDAMLGKPFAVLDHGFIRVVDYMGSDASVVQAARVSYGTGTKSVSDDNALIRYLLRNRHTTPFEMCELKLHVKLPIFVARQWIRHRTASVNEYSGRYSIIDNEFYIPSQEAIARQSTDNRQGRGEQLSGDTARKVMAMIQNDAERSYANYQDLLGQEPDDSDLSLSKELARIGLGLNFYTQWYWKTDLHNLMNFLKLRVDTHAQFEIRVYAERILQIMEAWVPVTYQAFVDYGLNARTLSGPMIEILRRRLAGQAIDQASSGLSSREWGEYEALIN